jgi:hypothetical protein
MECGDGRRDGFWIHIARLRRAGGGDRRAREALIMGLELMLGGALAVALLVLFLAALIRPENF